MTRTAIDLSLGVRGGMLGKERGDVAVGSDAEQQMSKSPSPSSRRVRLRGLSRSTPPSLDGISWTSLGVEPSGVASRSEGLLVVAVADRPRCTKRSSPHQSSTRDQSTAESVPSSAEPLIARVAIRPPVSAIWGIRKSRWISASRASSRAASASATSSAVA